MVQGDLLGKAICNFSLLHSSNLQCKLPIKQSLLTSSLIQPSYPLNATIFENVFRPEKFPKTDYTALIASLLHRDGKRDSNFKSGKIKCHKEYSNTSFPPIGVS